MGKVGKAGKAVVMRKTNQLLMVKDHYVQPPSPGELVIHNVYTSVNPVDCYMRSGLVKLQFFPKVRMPRGGRVVTSSAFSGGF
jgi:NADPH:quinone reductase-like Zn-dependent oxidoreductase